MLLTNDFSINEKIPIKWDRGDRKKANKMW